MPLISIYDPHPCRLRARSNRSDFRGFVASVVYVDRLHSRLAAQIVTKNPNDSQYLAERVGWGMWRAGREFEGAALVPWDGVPYEPAEVPPLPAVGEVAWSRSIVDPFGVVFAFGRPDETGPRMGRVSYSAARVDLGLVQGPQRWDHRSQYTTSRRVPVGLDWKIADFLDELEEGLSASKRRKKHQPPAADAVGLDGGD